MKRLRIHFIFFMMFMGSIFSMQNISLKECIKLALLKNPKMKAAKFQLEAAKKEKKEAFSYYLPHLNFSETFTNGNNPVYVFGTLLQQQKFGPEDFDINQLNTPDPVNNFRSRLTVYQSIWNGGKIRSANKMAKLNEEIKGKEVEATYQHLLFLVTSDYFMIQLAEENLKTARSALKSAKSNLEKIKNMYEQGMVVKSDLLRMKVYLADVKRKVLEAENNVNLSKEKLNVDLSLSLDPSFEISDKLKKIDVNLPAGSFFERNALKSRPELLSMEKAVKIAESKLKMAKSENYPSLGFFSTLDYNRGTNGGNGSNYILGVSLNYNLFDGFNKGAKIAEERANLEKYKAQYEELKNNILLQVKNAYLKMRTAHQQYLVALGAVKQAEESLRIVKNRYEAGLATVTDLLNSETALTASKTNLSMAIYNFNISYLNLEVAAGILNEKSPIFK